MITQLRERVRRRVGDIKEERRVGCMRGSVEEETRLRDKDLGN